MIHIQHLNKSYGSKQILNDIELKFETGKVYGIVGENGAGKSTLFNCISGIEQFEGRIDSDASPLKDRLGYLQTDPYFFPKITGREYIQLLCNAREVPVARMKEKNIFDLPLHQYASTYSTGMKKKLALTAILLQKNDFYILDEPFNGVDIQSNIVITDILKHLKTIGKTILISSHIFSTLVDICDEIFVLKEGVITRKVSKEGFGALEQEMKQYLVGNKIERLGL